MVPAEQQGLVEGALLQLAGQLAGLLEDLLDLGPEQFLEQQQVGILRLLGPGGLQVVVVLAGHRPHGRLGGILALGLSLGFGGLVVGLHLLPLGLVGLGSGLHFGQVGAVARQGHRLGHHHLPLGRGGVVIDIGSRRGLRHFGGRGDDRFRHQPTSSKMSLYRSARLLVMILSCSFMNP